MGRAVFDNAHLLTRRQSDPVGPRREGEAEAEAKALRGRSAMHDSESLSVRSCRESSF